MCTVPEHTKAQGMCFFHFWAHKSAFQMLNSPLTHHKSLINLTYNHNESATDHPEIAHESPWLPHYPLDLRPSSLPRRSHKCLRKGTAVDRGPAAVGGHDFGQGGAARHQFQCRPSTSMCFWGRQIQVNSPSANVYIKYTWWIIPLSKWVISPVINGYKWDK